MLGICTFVDGYMIGGIQTLLGTTISEDECGHLVHSQVPSANRATWRPDSGKCFSSIGSTGVSATIIGPTGVSVPVKNSRTCLFDGRLRILFLR